MKTAVAHRFSELPTKGRRFTGVAILLLLMLAWAAHARIGAIQPATVPAESPRAFVGAQACAPCHQKIHETWKSGRHSKMLQPPTAASVKGDFSKGSVTLHGTRFPLRATNGEYFITSSLTGKEREHRVEYTLGSRRIQHYLTTIEKGMIVVLPPTGTCSAASGSHNMDIVRPDERPTESRPAVEQGLRRLSRQPAGEQLSSGNRRVCDDLADFGTSCERCHGPGSAHVEAFTPRGAATSGRRGIDRPAHAARSEDEQHDLRAVPLAAQRRRS